MVVSRDPNHKRLIEQELTRLQLLRRFGAVGGGLSLLAFLAACGGGSGEQETAGEQATSGEQVTSGVTAIATTEEEIEQLTWAISGAIRGLDIAKAYDGPSQTTISLLFDKLVTYSKDLQLEEQVAESWEAVDPLTYVYRIREGITFWDGTPLTAEDTAFSMTRHMSPDTGSQIGSYFSSVDSIKVTGPNEVTVKLKTADPFWQYVPTLVPISSQAFIEAQGENYGAPGADATVLGTGPYELKSFKADEGLTLARFDSYWGKKPLAKNVDLQLIEDTQTRLLAMRAGEIDGAFDVPPGEADDWGEIDGVTLNSTPGMVVWFYCFDQETEPLNDIHVRRAFAHALDRSGIVQSLLEGYAEPAKAMVPPDQWRGLGLSDDRIQEIYGSLRDYEFNLDLAREELAQSSVPTGFEASIQYPNWSPEIGRATQSLAQNLQEIGITLTVREVDSQRWLNDLYEHKNLGLQVLRFSPDWPDPANYLTLAFDSRFATPNAFNLANYKNPRVDELLAQQAATTNPEERATAIAEILKISQDDLPYLSVWWEDRIMAIRNAYVYEGFHALYYSTPWARNILPAA